MREPLDAASRAPSVTEALKGMSSSRPLRAIDLAAGTGANLRYLGPLLEGNQEWVLIDDDQDLLDAVPALMQQWATGNGMKLEHSGAELIIARENFECRARRMRIDLAADLGSVDFPARCLVTGSALLDLASGPWLRALAQRCLAAGASILFALTYDGRIRCHPPEPEDQRLRELVNRHQRMNKGFGAALGSAAANETIAIFEALGYCMQWERSDWRIPPDERKLQIALIDGWLAAAVEIVPEERSALERWAERRRAHVARGRSELGVGHVDMLGWRKT